MTFEAALFDLDGTLLNSTHVWQEVDKIFLAKRGVELPIDYIDKVAHLSLYEAAVYTKKRFKLFNDTYEGMVQEWNDLCFEQYSYNVELKENVIEYLKYLKNNGVKMAVTTGLPHELLTPALKRLKIFDYFSVVASVEDVGKGKGHPDLYFYAAEKMAVPVENCIAFDDVITVVKMLKENGIKVCGVWDKNSQKYQNEMIKTADFYIKNWANAPTAL